MLIKVLQQKLLTVILNVDKIKVNQKVRLDYVKIYMYYYQLELIYMEYVKYSQNVSSFKM